MEIILVKTERALSRTQIALANYTINPYKGCLVGCLYCYSRSNSQIKKIKKQWGEYLYIKENFIDLLIKEIDQAKDLKSVLIGSTTEPFQNIDTEFDAMNSVLSILKSRNIPFTILTKSIAVLKYIDLLSYSPANKIYFTVNNPIIKELFEKNSSEQLERIKVVEMLLKANINTTVYISPVFPYITDMKMLLGELNGKVSKVYCESYNPKLGNWDELKLKLTSEVIHKIDIIYASESAYNSYWEQFKQDVQIMNNTFKFEMEFFIYPYNSYYAPG